jgi:ATP adenylyltransferase
MLTLVTSNPAKYAPFNRDLDRLRITLAPPKETLPELQCLSFAESVAAKARAAADMFGRPVLIDDAGLVLEAYQPFPGPLTSAVVSSLGLAGLQRLLNGTSDRARMECHIGCWIGGVFRSWTGVIDGRIDCSRQPGDQRMILSDVFVPDGSTDGHQLLHRSRALAALEREVFELHLQMAPEITHEATSAAYSAHQCPFCTEFDAPEASIFGHMMGDRLPNRVIYEDENFILMPPLGQFMEGGLLLLTREHLLSLAHLRPELFDALERLLTAIRQALMARWGVSPLIFEHGPAPDRGKGLCCVDHAHLNIFPAPVQVHPHLASRLHSEVGSLADLRKLRRAEFGYLFVQENDGSRRVYDGQDVPTQLVRRIIAAQMGVPDRWHWRDYPGFDELLATYNALKGQIRV